MQNLESRTRAFHRTVGALVGLGLAFTLTACGQAGSETAAPARSTSTATPTRIETPTPTPAVSTQPPQAAAEQDAPLPGCLAYTPAPVVQADGGDAVAAAAANAALPASVILNPGVQVIASVDKPGTLEAVARVCSEPLIGDSLLDVANSIALAIYQDPSAKTLSVLAVSSWTPDASTGYLEQVDTVTVDEYQLYLWDSPVAQDTAWQ